MGPLANPRHERFVQALFEGKPASTAYQEAGYSFNEGNAVRLKGNEKVQGRLAELQAETAKSSAMTVESLVAELETVRQHASSDRQWGSAVKAIAEKIKLSGLLTTKLEVKDMTEGPPQDATVEEIAAWFAWSYNDYKLVLSEEQKREFGGVLQHAFEAIENFLAPLAAKPVKTLPAKPQAEIERRRLGRAPRQIGKFF
jgi:hypothetical protein